MTPLDFYREQCNQGLIVEDPFQLMVLEHLQKLHQHLLQGKKKRSSIFSSWHPFQRIKGLYLWGGVGIGKTFLMDCFYQCLPFSEKMRMHFHAFMQLIHDELKKHVGEKDPLKIIARNLAKKTMVLCFDELTVTDITDAMLVGRLLNLLINQGVCLVSTSNVAPDELYKNGLQRKLFLPAIEIIKQTTLVVPILSKIDYRKQFLKNKNQLSEKNKVLEHQFNQLVNADAVNSDPIIIFGRSISVKKKSEAIIWFDFDVICGPHRSQKDYLAIAKKYKTILISDIPVIHPHEKNKICLLIRLVDVLYDAGIHLIYSSEESLDKIYTQGEMSFEYERTYSRLLEMSYTASH